MRIVLPRYRVFVAVGLSLIGFWLGAPRHAWAQG
jgi:hypothetical protein